MQEIVLTDREADKRLDKVLKACLPNAQDSLVYRMLRKKNITLNGRKAAGNEHVRAGDKVQLFFSDETFAALTAGKAGLEARAYAPPAGFPGIRVLYEDPDVCIFFKPQGVLSQKAKPSDYSVNEWCVYEARKNGFDRESAVPSFRPSVMNRLDRNTCGLMAAAFSDPAARVLSELIRSREVGKSYYTVVCGKTDAEGDLRGFLLKDERANRVRVTAREEEGAKPVHTRYTRLRYDGAKDLSLLRVELLTG
ncbi:MAG: RluA family pseudouridine synthase, partial [Lachnospiraceae bacterium]|nr:RluA family pseudouridine synthase [Lachnospiraceae bacterium]